MDALERRIEFGYDALQRPVRTWYRAHWAQEQLAGGVQKPCVYDLMELREAIHTAGRAAGLSAAPWSGEEIWTDAQVVAGAGVLVRATHFTEMRERIQDLWTAAGLGTLPQFSAGAMGGTGRLIETRDPIDLRTWLMQYEDSPWARTRRARVLQRYDDATPGRNGIGRRTGMWDGAGRQSWSYDAAGRVTSETRVIDGLPYTSQASYDAMDRLYRTILPDNEALTYSYGPNGLLTGLSGLIGLDSTTYLSGAEYNALDRPTRYLLGGVSPVRHTYYGLVYQGPDPSYPYGAPRRVRWPESGTALVDLTLSYDPVGNVTGIVDACTTPAESHVYEYDELDRLLRWGIGTAPPWQEWYDYDKIGNLTYKNGLPYAYDTPAHVHAAKTFNGVTHKYDANGSMTERGSQTLRYDPLRRPVRMNDNSNATIWRAAYNGDGVRRKRLDTNGTIHYVGGYERVRHEAREMAVRTARAGPDLGFYPQYPTGACGWSNPAVRSPRDNEPTPARAAAEPRGEAVAASIRRLGRQGWMAWLPYGNR